MLDDMTDVSAPHATPHTVVVHAREDLQMIHEASALLQSSAGDRLEQ
jgi:hypothetical protein